ncbi:thioredoxin family protein [Metabacillus sp. SLBN-84]
MKKIIVVGVSLTLSIFIIALVISNITEDKPLYNNISTNEYEKNLKKKNTFISYIYATSCPACQEFKPVLNNVIQEEDVEIHAVNLDVEDNRDRELYDSKNIMETPTLLCYENGIEKKRNVGYMSEKKLKSFIASCDINNKP